MRDGSVCVVIAVGVRRSGVEGIRVSRVGNVGMGFVGMEDCRGEGGEGNPWERGCVMEML